MRKKIESSVKNFITAMKVGDDSDAYKLTHIPDMSNTGVCLW